MPDPYASIVQKPQAEATDPYAALVQSAPPPPSTLDQIEHGHQLEDVGKGILEGVGSDVYNLGNLAGKLPLVGKYLAPSEEAQERLHSLVTPTDTSQKIGRGMEQVGEFLAPTGLEEAGAELGAKAVPYAGELLGKTAGAAVHSGLINKAQGGNFGTGVAIGAGGALIGSAAQKAAPALMELAQGIETPGRKTGAAILNETNAITPGLVTRSANKVVNRLTPELNEAADRASIRPLVAPDIPMAPFRETADEAAERMKAEPKKIYKTVGQLGKQLRTYANGEEVPEEVTPRELLDLKRGVGHAASWKPSLARQIAFPRNALYGQMNEAFENAVPEAGPLNRRISALIPATKPGASYLPLRIISPIGGASLGGYEGYLRGGPEEAVQGALLGGLAGATVRPGMNVASRLMWNPAVPKLAAGALLQQDHPLLTSGAQQ